MQLDRTRLLVVEDDLGFRDPLCRQLREAGFEVEVADDGVQALHSTREARPDVVLCDWGLPRLDGIEYCRSVKSDPELRSTYVAILTARDGSRDKVAALDAGADDFLVKPIDAEELLARVRAGVRVRRLQRELVGSQHRAVLLELAATLGHCVNNPLTAQLGHLELALGCLERNDLERTRHHIHQAGRLAMRIGDVGRRLGGLRDPRTTRYLGDLRMLDLEETDR